MKKLQSLNEDTFKNLEGFKIENLNAVKGAGEVTAGGSQEYPNGVCVCWSGDTRTDGGNFNYHGLRYC